MKTSKIWSMVSYGILGFMLILSPFVTLLSGEEIVGCPNAETTPIIQLSSFGVQLEHCIISLVLSGEDNCWLSQC